MDKLVRYHFFHTYSLLGLLSTPPAPLRRQFKIILPALKHVVRDILVGQKGDHRRRHHARQVRLEALVEPAPALVSETVTGETIKGLMALGIRFKLGG